MTDELVAYSIVLLTDRHSISGELLYRDQRLSDYLNDRRETVVSLRDVSVARLDEPGKILQKHPAAVVPKSWVVLAFEPPQPAIPPGKRFHGFVKKEAHEVFFMLNAMEVRGTLHTTGNLDLRRVLALPDQSFLPVTNAVVTLVSNNRFVIEQEAVLVSAAHIEYIGKLSAKTY